MLFNFLKWVNNSYSWMSGIYKKAVWRTDHFISSYSFKPLGSLGIAISCVHQSMKVIRTLRWTLYNSKWKPVITSESLTLLKAIGTLTRAQGRESWYLNNLGWVFALFKAYCTCLHNRKHKCLIHLSPKLPSASCNAPHLLNRKEEEGKRRKGGKELSPLC